MVTYANHTPESLDVADLAAFSLRVYRDLAIPFTHGDSLAEIETFLTERCPDFIVMACVNGELAGWAGLYYEHSAQANLLSWHPLVLSADAAISEQLMRACIDHCESTGRSHMQVMLRNLSAASEDMAAKVGAMYESAGMVRGVEWVSMVADLHAGKGTGYDFPSPHELKFHSRLKPQALPHAALAGMGEGESSQPLTLHPLNDFTIDDLWPAYDAAFTHGVDHYYAQQTPAQRRFAYNSIFYRPMTLVEDASLALCDGETLVGFVHVTAAGGNAYVTAIGIIPAYRRQGLAKSLLSTAMQRTAEHHRRLILYVDATNVAAVGLYRGIGFVDAGTGWVTYVWDKRAAFPG